MESSMHDVLQPTQVDPLWDNSYPLGLRCAIRLRAVLLSTLGKASYPYCQYMRAYDFRDLERMFRYSYLEFGEDEAIS